MTIRNATAEDLPAITAIYAHAVLTGTGSFEIEPPSQDEMAARMSAIQQAGMPWIVFEKDSAVIGYAYFGPFKPRAAYANTVEDSIYIDEAARGRGIGKALLEELIDRAKALGKTQMIGGVGDSENHGSVGLHKACGFRQVGRLERVGFKFGRWLDVVYMQRDLGD
ncbi:GNAT family N-acetyltransferase [Pseudahrensia aquimaris]|uniref:GNAT family N-acetyltransferase n=1 Tax=Pseudahrensia aquimaris TaxID=744461 RepID=A0ABW3FET6_9HYPH